MDVFIVDALVPLFFILLFLFVWFILTPQANTDPPATTKLLSDSANPPSLRENKVGIGLLAVVAGLVVGLAVVGAIRQGQGSTG